MKPADSKRPLTILHTNDFHNRLSADKIQRIANRFRETPDPKLLLDAGDAGGSSNITFRPAGEPILADMSQIGYQAMTVGNRDFHVSRVGFRAKVGKAAFPILCANIRPTHAKNSDISQDCSDRPLEASTSAGEPNLRSHVVYELDGWRILVYGLTVPMVTPTMWERKLSAYVFDPPVRAAAVAIPALRERYKPDFTIALTHIGLRLDRLLATSVPGIDLIIGGHSHELLANGETIGSTLIVQAGSHGRYIGIVVVEPERSVDSRFTVSARIEEL